MTQTLNSSTTRVSPLFQIICILLSASIITLMLYIASHNTQATEPMPLVEQINPETLTEFGGFPDEVTVGLYIEQFQTLDILHNNFMFNGIIWFLLNPGVISLDSLQKFEFQRGEIVYLSKPNIQLYKKKLLVQYHARVKFTSALDYQAFPIDNHKINLVFTHPFITLSEALFESSTNNFVVKAQTEASGWKLQDQQVSYGYVTARLNEDDAEQNKYIPQVIFSMDFVRIGSRAVVSILLPLLLVFYLAMFTFSLDPRLSITIATGSITAILAYRFVIENLSPATGYFMLADYLFFLFLTASCFVFCLNVVNAFTTRIKSYYKKYVIVAIHLIVLIAIMYAIQGTSL